MASAGPDDAILEQAELTVSYCWCPQKKWDALVTGKADSK